MANLRKRKFSKNWVCCYTSPDGTRAQRSTGLTDHKKAVAVCLQWEEEAERAKRGEFTESQARKVHSAISLRAGLGPIEFSTAHKFLTDWINSKEITKASGTVRRYKFITDSLIQHLDKRADLNLASVQSADIQSFRDVQVKEGKSNESANMAAVKTLRIAFNLVRRQGLIMSNPAEGVDLHVPKLLLPPVEGHF